MSKPKLHKHIFVVEVEYTDEVNNAKAVARNIAEAIVVVDNCGTGIVPKAEAGKAMEVVVFDDQGVEVARKFMWD